MPGEEAADEACKRKMVGYTEPAAASEQMASFGHLAVPSEIVVQEDYCSIAVGEIGS